MLKGFIDWLDATQLSLLFKTTHWLVPASQSVHILAVAVVLSAFLMLTLRGHGVTAPGVGISLLNARFLPWVWISIVVLLVTGAMQIVAEPTRALPNPFFQAKMAFLLIVMAMVGWFQRSVARNPDGWDGRHLFPAPIRAMFAVVLLLTLAIIFCGRWIAYATV